MKACVLYLEIQVSWICFMSPISNLMKLSCKFIFASSPQISYSKAVVSKRKRTSSSSLTEQDGQHQRAVLVGYRTFRCVPHLPPLTGLFLVFEQQQQKDNDKKTR